MIWTEAEAADDDDKFHGNPSGGFGIGIRACEL